MMNDEPTLSCTADWEARRAFCQASGSGPCLSVGLLRIRGELAMGAHLRAADLYSVGSAGIASVVSSRCLVAVAGGLEHLPLGRHIPGAGVPAVAQGEPPDARLPGDNRSIGRIGIGIMHRAIAEFMVTEPAAAGNEIGRASCRERV